MKAKIPPPLVLVACGILMWLTDKLLPRFSFVFPTRLLAFWIFLLMGVLLLASGASNFLRRNTTIHPDRKSLSKATTLVTTGIYRYSRNPIYLGMAIMLVAWVIFLQNWLSVLGVIIFVLFIDYYQIRPEEQALEKVFGEEYVRYKRRVRRWV
jgi:protein-S-isoprenylcysteine O-methyltransferase Ste14